MRRPSRTTNPPDTPVGTSVVSFPHDVAFGALVVGQIAITITITITIIFRTLNRLVDIIFRILKRFITIAFSFDHTILPILNIVKTGTRYGKNVIATFVGPFVASLHTINALCTSCNNNLLLHNYFILFEGLLFVIGRICFGLGWQNICSVMVTLLRIWVVLGFGTVVVFLRHRWKSRRVIKKGLQKKDETEGPDKERYSEYAQRRRPLTPESYRLAHSHHGSMNSELEGTNGIRSCHC